MNRQYGVGDSKYVVICDAPTLGDVIRRMRIAPKTLYNGDSHQHTALTCRLSPLKVAKCKYVVICDAPKLSHVKRRMRIAPKCFIKGRLISKLPSIVTAVPESCKVNRQYGVGIPNMWLFVTPLP